MYIWINKIVYLTFLFLFTYKESYIYFMQFKSEITVHMFFFIYLWMEIMQLAILNTSNKSRK